MKGWLLALALLWPVAATAEQIVLGLSENEVAITATFDGSDILIFGGVRRDGAPDPEPLDVIVAVSGPLQPLTVRQAERTFGIWINRGAVRVASAPTFYAVASTRPLDRALTETEDLRHAISLPRAIRAFGADVGNREDYIDALIRIRSESGHYQVLPGGVTFAQQTLFRTRIGLPSDLTEGDYATRIYLTRHGEVVDSFDTVIAVRKVGLERVLTAMSRDDPALYGLLSLAIAVAAGWGAQWLFQRLKA